MRHLQLICLTGNEINIDIKQTLSSFLMAMKQTKTMINKRSFIDSSQSQYSWQKNQINFLAFALKLKTVYVINKISSW